MIVLASITLARPHSSRDLLGRKPAAIDAFVVHVMGLALSEFGSQEDGHLLLYVASGLEKERYQFFPRCWR